MISLLGRPDKRHSENRLLRSDSGAEYQFGGGDYSCMTALPVTFAPAMPECG
jgi:hypothetical protein